MVVFEEWRSGSWAGFIGVSLGEWAVMNKTNGLAHSNQNATPQIIVTMMDYKHTYDSMQRYPELLALKYQKMKENEP